MSNVHLTMGFLFVAAAAAANASGALAEASPSKAILARAAPSPLLAVDQIRATVMIGS